MSLYLRTFLLTLAVNVVAILPFLLFYRVGWLDSIGMVVFITAVGPFMALKAIYRGTVAPDRKEEVVVMSALSLPIFLLVLHAAVRSAFHFQDTGRVLPDSNTHWVAMGAALVGFSAWCCTGLYFNSRRRKLGRMQPGSLRG